MAKSTAATVRVRGLNETLRALHKVNREVSGVVRDELKEAAGPVSEDARMKVSRYPGASTKTIGPKVGIRGVSVTQRAKKVTGLRPDFGGLQQQHLEDALDENESNVVDAVEDALDRLTYRAGLH